MRQVIRRGAAIASHYAKARPEAFWSMIGIAVGVIAGFSIGGIGITARGGATGLSNFAVLLTLASVGGLIGNRVGIWIDRRTKRN